MRNRLVVIGNGMAGIACLERILALAPDGFDVTVVGAESHPNYNRILLSKLFDGETKLDELVLNPVEWYEQNNVGLALGVGAQKIDRERHLVVLADGTELPYDRVVIATGSNAILLPIPGNALDGVFVFRTVDDCRGMVAAARSGARRAAVIGGGLLGLEAAYGLMTLGLSVTVVHLVDRLMERQLDATGAAYLRRKIRAQGIDVRLSTETREIRGEDGRVRALAFADGSELPCDVVVMAAGIRPNAELARASGLDCKRGVVVDDFMRTSDHAVYAVGECAEHRGVAYGLVQPLYEQGRVLAAHLCGEPVEPYAGSVVSTKLKVSGVDVFSAGDFAPEPGDDASEVLRVEDGSVYKKLVVRDGRLTGAVLVGDLGLAADVDRAIKSGDPIDARALLFGSATPSQATPPQATVLALADDAIVCACNGVDKKSICDAIVSRDLKTRKEVAACTNASRSCGGCGPQVDALLRAMRGGDLPAEACAPAQRPLCDCTMLTRADVVAAIRERHFTRVRDVLDGLGWTTEGCATCRPAINYYLTMCWPGENEDDPRSRFINERVHANIQRDGTYSVVPRMYGGVTTPDELIRIGEVARKFGVPTVKVTGGQRIDLLGVAKEDLPAIWKELELPSGFAYAKAVRTVKTCVGSTWCRFGTRDSMGMGIRLEQSFENLWTPAKVKMGVNACPRNCAESLIKDVGLIAGDKVWDVYVGGNGGVHVRQAELLCSIESDDECVEIVGAFLQLYREEAHYGDRTSVFVADVGIDAIKKRVVEDRENRKALYARIGRALDGRVDPWRERVEKLASGDDTVKREFGHVSLKVVA